MDQSTFDRLARLLSGASSRRTALGTLLGASALGVVGTASGKTQRKRQARNRNRNRIAAQATCAPPGAGVNRDGCNYDGEDFSGQDLHGSSYRTTVFTNTTLVKTDLHGSNARGTDFRRANLCGAKLFSSTLRDATFRNANLTRADLHSSACGGAIFTGATLCQTITCTGTVRNDDCPSGVVCCDDGDCGAGEVCQTTGGAIGHCACATECCQQADCGVNEICDTGTCRCAPGAFPLENGTCAYRCATDDDCAPGCVCAEDVNGRAWCTAGPAVGLCPSGQAEACPPGSSCFGGNQCLPLCGMAAG